MSSGSDKRQRPHILRVRVSDEELAALTSRAEAANRSLAAYLRAVGLEQSPRTRDTAALVAALSRIGNNLNQLAKRAHQTGHVEAAAVLAPMLDELRDTLEGLA